MEKRLGPYQLVEEIGAGGMGVVYRAYDPRLERDVAIKLLHPGTLADPAARSRFRKEALASSKLNHPGIGTIHDIGEHEGTDYLVMELVPGTTLDAKVREDPLAEHEVVDLGIQLADALRAAHEHHIVHRDLKPGNLRLTPDGRLKILDFGLARSIKPASGLTATQSLIEPEGVSGTLPYMAPEQLRNERVDERADIWAAGAVLYELATGRRPFSNSSAMALAAEILERVPTAPRRIRPELSDGFESIVLRCLEKESARRYASAQALGDDLRRLAGGQDALRPAAARSGSRSAAAVAAALALCLAGAATWSWLGRETTARADVIAVLPLRNTSSDPDQDHYADGLTDALVTELGRIERLKVIARASVESFGKSGRDPKAIASALGVDALVEGTVRRSGDRLEVDVRLVEARTGEQLWHATVQRDLADAAPLPRSFAEGIAGALRLPFASASKPAAARQATVHPETYETYLRGRHFWNKRGLEDLKKAAEYFQKAIDREPTYGPAYSGLADTYLSLYDYGYLSAADVTVHVRNSARKALELDPSLAEAHNSLAHLALHDWEWARAEEEFRKAIDLDRGYVPAYHWYALCLTSVGRTAEAIAIMQQAQQLDPLSLRINADLGMALLAGGRFDEAVAQEWQGVPLLRCPRPCGSRGTRRRDGLAGEGLSGAIGIDPLPEGGAAIESAPGGSPLPRVDGQGGAREAPDRARGLGRRLRRVPIEHEARRAPGLRLTPSYGGELIGRWQATPQRTPHGRMRV